MLSDIFLPEVIGTAMVLTLGCGVVANAVLPRTAGNGGGFLMINFGWGVAVFAGVYVAFRSGAHLNPAVTLGLLASGADLSVAEVLTYLSGQLLGAFLGAAVAWASYKEHFADPDAGADEKLAVFSTMPAIRSVPWNLVTEIVGTFVLVFVIISFGKTPSELGPLAVALLVVGIGASLGGPTGYAINPARDLGPRIAHAVLPIPRKGSSGWSYAWVPVVGPVVGGILGGIAANAIGYV